MHESRNIGILDHLIHTYLGQGPAGGPPTGVELSTTLKWFSTTLLNVLAQPPTLGNQGYWDGEVRLNGGEPWERDMAYVI